MSDKAASINKKLIDAWSNSIGGVALPHCHICNHPVDSIQLSANIENNEYLIDAHCHGDSCRLHIPLWYAGLIEHRLDVNQALSPTPDKRGKWALPTFFSSNCTRYDGTLHFDIEQLLAEDMSKTPEGKKLLAELQAKQQFQEEWMHAAKTNHIHEITPPQ